MDLGLDLGTTRTVVAHADRGNYPVLSFPDEHEDAHDHVPTVVADDVGRLVFGFEALAAARCGAPLLRSVKRALGDPGVSAATTVRVGEREVRCSRCSRGSSRTCAPRSTPPPTGRPVPRRLGRSSASPPGRTAPSAS